jgi:ABC-type antimicrobial peptide transport system permease subunit
MAYVVALQTREIGIRMALGAVPRRVLWSVLRRASVQLTAGLAVGLPAAWMRATLVSGFLFQTHPQDAWVYGSVAATLAATGLGAALVPARRASRIDPVRALKYE